MKRLLLFISILLVSHLIASTPDSKPHIVLFFDVNKTIVPNFDTKNLDTTLNELLSETTEATWDPSCKKPISFASYSQNPEEKAHFLTLVQEKWPNKYEELFRQYIEMKVKIRNSGPCNASFLRLIDYLEENHVSYSLILRSYDANLEKTMRYLMNAKDIPFVQPLRFSGGVLEDDTTHIYDMNIVYEIFKRSPALGIQDDLDAWTRHQKSKDYGKPFPVNLEEEENVVFCFFDPNINENPKSATNSVTLVDINSNALIDAQWALQKKMLIKVNPLQALMDDNYFIDKVEESVEAQRR